MPIFRNKIIEALSDAHLAKSLEMETAQLKSFAHQEEWSRRVMEILDHMPIRVAEVADLASDYLKELRVKLPDNWPMVVYQLGSHRLFPANFHDDVSKKVEFMATFTLDLIGLYLEEEHKRLGYQEDLYFLPADEEERNKSAHSDELRRLHDAWDAYYIQEILRLGREVQYFDLLAHITGVHRIALTVGRQLAKDGVPVDLALVSGAARAHDIGKFGCRNDEEQKRMAYLHYYYTEEWCARHHLLDIGHIAMNHSTWDVEMENLPVESLLLIYADFRVKARTGPRGEKEVMEIYSLKDSFEVILNKLDNVDEAKKERYQRVYNKLADFEAYMLSHGVDTTLGERRPPEKLQSWLGMLDATTTPFIFKDLAFTHNIAIMNELSDPDYLRSMLEALRSSGKAVDIRAYLNVFEEYMTYMTRGQKELINSYLMEMLIHPEGDIRRHAARLIGALIADFDERYRKWLPEDVVMPVRGHTAMDLWQDLLERIFDPDHKLGGRYRRFQGYAFQNTVTSLLGHLDEERISEFIMPLLRYYRVKACDELTAFILLDALYILPLTALSERDYEILIQFAKDMLLRNDVEVRVAALRFFERSVAEGNLSDDEKDRIFFAVRDCDELWSGEAYLKAHIKAIVCGGEAQPPPIRASVIFLENLKSSTPWILKVVNIRRVADALVDNPQMNRLHAALHFSNLLKVSEQIAVRHDAGQMLVQIAPMLTPEEVNEVVVELNRGLEMDSFEFTKYIPEYLASFASNLRAQEMDEFLGTLESLLDTKNETVAQLALDTLAYLVAEYEDYRRTVKGDDKFLRDRLSRILGSIMKGLASYHESVQVETLSDLGQLLFGNQTISLQYKQEIFDIIYKRLLMLMITSGEESKLIFYGHCATLNHLYRFLSDYLFRHGDLQLYENKKVAFFPGTFDPFTLGHKGIVRLIRDQGFDVFLGLDEFSWSKNTQPSKIRRKILQMSLASEENVFIFPSIFPVNLASEEDLGNLAGLFSGKSLYLVVGSDVVRGASAYQKNRENSSVHTFNHLIVRRPDDGFSESDRQRALNLIEGDVLEVTLEDCLEGVSSTIIRKNIDKNRDISHLIDKMAQNYIYENNLYLGEAKMKPIRNPAGFDVRFIQAQDGNFWSDVELFLQDGNTGSLSFLGAGVQPESRLVVVREKGRLTALALVQIVSSLKLYDVVGSREVSHYLREHGASRMAVISNLNVRDGGERSGQRALTNAILWGIENAATYAIYAGRGEEEQEALTPLLSRQGFRHMPFCTDERWYSLVNMRMPMLIANNVGTLLKQPYRSMPEVKQAIFEAHCDLQQALTGFHPGYLVLTYDSVNLEDEMARLVTIENGVPDAQGEERVLGEAMCVPYGHLLRSAVVPNTVTKPFFVQRLYQANMRRLEISPLPYHESLASQAQVLHSFRRPVILVDEVLNRGRTLELISPLLKDANVSVQSIACGIITGDGRDLLESMDMPYRYVHYVPSLRYWLVDSKGYPFIDGYSRADRPITMTVGLESSINPMLPYTAPPLFRESKVTAAWNYSKVSLTNAWKIMSVLEEVYQRENERNLTLNRLPEVLIRPMLPDPGSSLSYDFTRNASWYIEQDLARLDYLKNIIPREEDES